jgi:hypothetical protein
MNTTTLPPGANFVVWLIVLVAIGFVMMVLFKVAVWYGSRVNNSDDAAPVVMSRSADGAPVDRASSKDGQNDGRTDSDQVGRAELLTLYKILRKYGIPREEVRPALKGVRVPLSNDVWANAAAPVAEEDDGEIVTPYAGRRTKASYYPEQPDLEYQAPA